MAITYKSVIAKAINDFNGVQNALSKLEALYPSTTTKIGLTTTQGTKLLQTDTLGSIIENQLQLKAVGTALLDISKFAAEANEDGYYVSAQDVSAEQYVAIPGATYETKGNTTTIKTAGYVAAGLKIGEGSPAGEFKLNVTDNEKTALSIAETVTSVNSVNYYVVSGSVSAAVTADVLGYFTDAGTGTITDASSKLGLIKKADFSVVDSGNTASTKIAPTQTLTGKATTMTGAIAYGDAITSDYETIDVTLKATGTGTGTVTTTEGYVRQDTDTPVTITIDDTKTTDVKIGVKKAQWGTLSAAGSALAVDKASLSSNEYTVKANVTATATVSTNGAGYTSSTGALTHTNAVVGKIAKGSAETTITSITNGITAGSDEANKSGSTIAKIAFMENTPSSSLQEGKDYFVIRASAAATASTTLSTGYVYTGDTVAYNGFTGTSNETTKYIGAAKFKYVKNEGPDGVPHTFIQCQTAGYLTTGLLAIVDTNNDGTITDEIDWAEVKASISGVGISTGSAVPATNAYELNISKASVNPGYISGSDGSLTLDTKYWIAKGSVTSKIVDNSLIPTVDKVTTAIAESSTATDYVIKLTPKAKVKTQTVVTEGYVKATETHTDAEDTTASASEEMIYIKEATFASTANVPAVTPNSTSPSASGSKAIAYDSTSSLATYVTFEATGYDEAKVSVAGHTKAAGTVVSAAKRTVTGKIEAAVGSATRSLDGSSTQSTAAEYTATEYSNNTSSSTVTHTADAAANKVKVTTVTTVTDTAIKDKYIIGNYVSEVEANGTMVLPADATGSNVDDYVNSLYSRMLGYSYTAVSAD